MLAFFQKVFQKGSLSNFLYVLSSIYHQEVRQREKTLISNVIPEQVQEASLLQIDFHVIIKILFLISSGLNLSILSFLSIFFSHKRLFISSLPSTFSHLHLLIRFFCSRSHQYNRYGYLMRENMLCAGEEGKDSCSGNDSFV